MKEWGDFRNLGLAVAFLLIYLILKESVLHADLMFPSILSVHIIIHTVNLPIIIQLTN